MEIGRVVTEGTTGMLAKRTVVQLGMKTEPPAALMLGDRRGAVATGGGATAVSTMVVATGDAEHIDGTGGVSGGFIHGKGWGGNRGNNPVEPPAVVMGGAGRGAAK